MKMQLFILGALCLLVLGTARGQAEVPPAQALERYQQAVVWQSAIVDIASDTTCVEAKIPSMSKEGKLCLERTYLAPRSLQYMPASYAGDRFVEVNVIARLLTSDIRRVEQGSDLTITDRNYRFAYQRKESVPGGTAYVFAVKPRRKSPGLFKGQILIDAEDGRILRASGRLVNTSSWWLKRVDFVQDYVRVGSFSFPVSTDSTISARFVGRVDVRLTHAGYQVNPRTEVGPTQQTSVGSFGSSP
jgi:hypothetical protein